MDEIEKEYENQTGKGEFKLKTLINEMTKRHLNITDQMTFKQKVIRIATKLKEVYNDVKWLGGGKPLLFFMRINKKKELNSFYKQFWFNYTRLKNRKLIAMKRWCVSFTYPAVSYDVFFNMISNIHFWIMMSNKNL